jgi:curved DNA-binding protein CbpA
MTDSDPYSVLGVPEDSDDEAIRARYLELIRQFPPEQHPEKFSVVRVAYEKLRDLDSRVRYRLFEHGKQDSLDQIAEELACQMPRRRPGLRVLMQAYRAD